MSLQTGCGRFGRWYFYCLVERSAFHEGEWPDGPTSDGLRAWNGQNNHLHPEIGERPEIALLLRRGRCVQTKFKVESAGGQYPEDTWYAWLKRRVGPNPSGEDRQGLLPNWPALPIPVG